MAPMELHFWPTPNGWKIAIMLEECGLPYDIHWVDLSKKAQFDPGFLALSPNGRMPALMDPDGPGGGAISIFESGAILQYLGNKTGRFYPADQRRRSDVEQWLFWQMAGLGPMAGQAAHFRNYKADKIDYAIKRYTDEVIRLYNVMNTQLAGRDFLAVDQGLQGLWHRPDRVQASAGLVQARGRPRGGGAGRQYRQGAVQGLANSLPILYLGPQFGTRPAQRLDQNHVKFSAARAHRGLHHLRPR